MKHRASLGIAAHVDGAVMLCHEPVHHREAHSAAGCLSRLRLAPLVRAGCGTYWGVASAQQRKPIW